MLNEPDVGGLLLNIQFNQGADSEYQVLMLTSLFGCCANSLIDLQCNRLNPTTNIYLT